MDDENWTVVVGRRASKLRHSVVETASSNPFKQRRKAIHTPPLQARHANQECDEALLLLKMKRSMHRVQESAFFKMLVDQMQTLPVLEHLRRAASGSSFDVVNGAQQSIPDEGKILANLGMSAHDSNQDITLQTRSSIMEEDACGLLRTPCESSQAYSNASKAVAEACIRKDCSNVEGSLPKAVGWKMSHDDNQESNGANAFSQMPHCVSMECESSLKVSNGRHDTEIEHGCRWVEVACSATHVESTDGLSGINGIDGGKQLTAKQRLCSQISEKPWFLQVVVYGLGSIADSEISRCQFALILLLKQRFSWVRNVEVYDPVLSQSECKVIADMGCLPLLVNEEGKRSISRPTLFYMPHCEEWLYDNVLQANWVPQTLGQLVILGNSFQDYQERWSVPIGGKPNPPFYVKQYQQVAREIPLKPTSPLDLPGFNNMSWHFYPLPDKGNCITTALASNAESKLGVSLADSNLVVI